MIFKSRSSKKRAVKVLRISILVIFALCVLAPIYLMVLTSFKTDMEIVNVETFTFWPKTFSFDNYVSLFENFKFDVYLKNSILLSVISALIVLLFSIFGGYSLARYRFRGKIPILLFLLITQMVPAVLVFIPIFIIFSQMGLINTRTGLVILYSILNLPFCIITMRGVFEQIPTALEEAAYVDGCSKIKALFKIVLPVMFPGIAAVFIFAFIGVWNDLLVGVIFTSKSALWTIPVGLKAFVGKYNVQWGQLMAGATISLIPTVVMFAIVQKYIVSGLTSGSVKE